MFARGGVLVIALALAGLAGCVTNTRVNLSNAAQNLEYNANALVHDTGHEKIRGDERTDVTTDYSHYSHEYARDAAALARNAHELRVAIDQGASKGEVHAVFDRLSRSYHAVRDEISQSDSLEARRDFGPLTDSYHALAHELGVHVDRGEYLPPA